MLTAGQLSNSSQVELGNAFCLNYSIPELIAHSSIAGCALVVDGFEKLEGDSRSRALELIDAVRGEEFTGWRVVITCQTRSWELVQQALREVNVSDAYRVAFDTHVLQDIIGAVQHLPGIPALFVRNELQPILRNLVVLDWVLRADVASRFSASRPWIGET